MRTTYKIRAQIEVIEDEGDRVTNWSVGEWVEIKEFRSRKKAEAFLKQLSTHAEDAPEGPWTFGPGDFIHDGGGRTLSGCDLTRLELTAVRDALNRDASRET